MPVEVNTTVEEFFIWCIFAIPVITMVSAFISAKNEMDALKKKGGGNAF